MAFAQLTFRESLRDIGACLRVQSAKLYHLGMRTNVVARNTLAHANATRDWRIYAEFAQRLIGIARKPYASESFAVEPKKTVYALDATLINLCLTTFAGTPSLQVNAYRAPRAAHTHTGTYEYSLAIVTVVMTRTPLPMPPRQP